MCEHCKHLPLSYHIVLWWSKATLCVMKEPQVIRIKKIIKIYASEAKKLQQQRQLSASHVNTALLLIFMHRCSQESDFIWKYLFLIFSMVVSHSLICLRYVSFFSWCVYSKRKQHCHEFSTILASEVTTDCLFSASFCNWNHSLD